jgi:hypothetical protein
MTLLYPKLDTTTIFDKYDKSELLPKLQSLKLFCLLRGRLNSYEVDGDILEVSFSYVDKADLIKKCNSIGLPLQVLNPDEPKFDKPMPADIANKLPTPTKLFPEIAQPYQQTINNQTVFVIIHDYYFSISTVDKMKEKWMFINDKEIDSAVILENLFFEIGLADFVTIDEQKKYGRYINRYHYPELFS